MANSLTNQIGRVCRRLQRRRFVAAVGWVAAATLAVGLAMMLADYFFRSTDQGLRWLAAAALVVAFVTVLRRRLLPVLTRPANDDLVAQLVQERYPQLGSRLASALEFSRQPTDEPKSGSADLRRAVVVEATTEVESLDMDEVIDPAPGRRAIGVLGAALAAAAAFLFADPSGFAVAGGRLLAPWSELDWPRRHRLEVSAAPDRLARGQVFEATVVDQNGALPENLMVEYRSRVGGAMRVDELPLPVVGQVGAVRRENVQRSFSFRATGGDSPPTPWFEVDVIDPPQVAQVEIIVTPPAYSGLEPYVSGPDLRLLSGSRVALRAQGAEPLQAAAIEIQLSKRVVEIPAEVTASPMGAPVVSVAADSWLAEASGEEAIQGVYSLRIESASGLVGRSGPRAYRVEPDPPPELKWVSPQGDLFVTSAAVVRVVAEVSDNLAIQSVDLTAISSVAEEGESPLATVGMHAGPEQPPAQSKQAPQQAILSKGESLQASAELRLEELSLTEGDQVLIAVEATDYRPGVGRTATTRRVTIISAEELDSRIAAAASGIARDLERALKQQRSSKESALALEIEQRAGEAIDRAVIDRLTTLGYEQRRVASTLGDSQRGAAKRAADLLKEIQDNRLDRPELAAGIERVAAELRRLAGGPLPAAERALADSRRSAERQLDPRSNPAEQKIENALASAQEKQREVVESLEGLVDSLGRWSDLQRFLREASELERQQRSLAADTRREAARSAASPSAPARQAERQKLADTQAELNRRFERLQRSMRQQLEDQESSSSATQPLADALAESQERATGGRMTDSSRRISRGQLGRAAEQQLAAADDLQQMLETLRNRAERDPRKLAEQLREAQQRLEELRERAAQEAGAPADDQQAERRQRLAEQAERLGRRLERLTAPQAGQSAQSGGQQMSQSAEQSPSNPSQAAQSMRQADQDLQEAQQQLAQRMQQLQEEITQNALQKLASDIEGYVRRQRQILEGTVLAADQSQAELKNSTRRLGGDQRLLERRIAAAADGLSGREVFEMALQEATAQMQQAAQNLESADAGRATQEHERLALVRLTHIARSLEPDPSEPPSDSEQDGQGGQGGGQPSEPPPIAVAELKMLRLMQLDINARTRVLEADSAAGLLSEEQSQSRGRRLAGEQERLADLVRELAARNNDQPSSPPRQATPRRQSL